jgi:CTP synthase (UTP-ammonia lyase)
MKNTLRIGLIGDFNPDVTAHVAIPRALRLASRRPTVEATVEWLPTPSLESETAATLAHFDGLWCVPASPYASMEGALEAIRFARERRIPFLGTCGGSQHALIEYARDVLQITEAEHAETNPETAMPLIAPLACSLVEVSDTIIFKPGSRIAAIYGKSEVSEQYHCSFGLNPRYHELFDQGNLHITGLDRNGEARAFELADHPFYFLTLFQPERSALADREHPLIVAYLQVVYQARQPPA